MGNKKATGKKVPARKARRSAAPTKKPLRLAPESVGQWFETRCGNLANVDGWRSAAAGSLFEFTGIVKKGGRESWARNGRIFRSQEHPYDLIREVKAPKARKAGK